MTDKQDQQAPERTSPSMTIAVVGSCSWVVVAVVLFVVKLEPLAYGIIALAVVLVIAGFFCGPMGSGLSFGWTALIPVWGLVARADRIRTCGKLRDAKIFLSDDPAATIPAHTYKRNKDVFVQFDGGGLSDMNPEHLRELLVRNARVWRCRSFAISEESERPGLFTIQLSKNSTVTTLLDRPITGVVE